MGRPPKPLVIPPTSTAEGLRLIHRLYDLPNDAAVVARLGIEHARWSNYLRGLPVPRDMALEILAVELAKTPNDFFASRHRLAATMRGAAM